MLGGRLGRVKQVIAPALKIMGVIVVAVVLHLLAWPVEIDPAPWTPPRAPSPTGVLAPSDRLTRVEKLAKGHRGPESVAIDEQGALYTGLLDGRIVRIGLDDGTVETYARAREPLGNGVRRPRRPNGRLLAYDSKTGRTRLLLDGLYFPNGIAVGPNGNYLVFNETSMYRVQRHWLVGDRAGQTDVFVENLPGFPDNVTFDGADTFWIALAGGPRLRAMLDPLLPHPFLRTMMWRVPGLFGETSTGEGYILAIDLQGNVIHTLQDGTGQTYPDTTSVIEYKGSLYIGSFSADGVGRIPVPESPVR